MKHFTLLGMYLGYIWTIPGAPLAHQYEINEIDGKCRTSSGKFLRLPFLRIAIVLGRWRDTGLTEAEMFARVFKASATDLYDEDGNLLPRFMQAARDTVAEHAQDPDDEWQILQAIGLDE